MSRHRTRLSRNEVAASYRLNAAYCFDAARVTPDPGRRLSLLNMAQAWTDLADQMQKAGKREHSGESGTPLQAQLIEAAKRDSPKPGRRQ